MTWTKRIAHDPYVLEALLQPETESEYQLLKLPEFRVGLLWGEPRFGHPEGKVIFHVREVLDNIDRILHLAPEIRTRLRLVAITHDTFKFAEDRTYPRDWTRHHGYLARRYVEAYTSDLIALDLIEVHDDAYYAWRYERHTSFQEENPFKSLDMLLRRVDYCLQQYYLFFKCDTQTGDKTQASLKWFERTVPGLELVKVRE